MEEKEDPLAELHCANFYCPSMSDEEKMAAERAQLLGKNFSICRSIGLGKE